MAVSFTWAKDRSITGYADIEEESNRVIDVKAVVAEFVAMTVFVIIGCGTACSNGASDGQTRIIVAFAFGMAIMVLAYSIGHHSGGHINCAVTLSLVLGGQVPWRQGVFNFFGQMLGSIAGATILCAIFPCESDMTTTLGTNIVNPMYSAERVLVAEAFGTFLLCFTIWETAVTSQASCGKNACIAIGFAVFLAHVMLLPIDGCSINPSRSFGPAIVSAIRGCSNYTKGGLEDLWIMWVGPLAGAIAAAIVQKPFAPIKVKKDPLSVYGVSDGAEPSVVLGAAYDVEGADLPEVVGRKAGKPRQNGCFNTCLKF